MGFALAELHVPPDQFWSMTMAEIGAAYAYLMPREDSEQAFEPFSDEELNILAKIKARG